MATCAPASVVCTSIVPPVVLMSPAAAKVWALLLNTDTSPLPASTAALMVKVLSGSACTFSISTSPAPGAVMAALITKALATTAPVPVRSTTEPPLAAVRPLTAPLSTSSDVALAPSASTRLTVTPVTLPTVSPLNSLKKMPLPAVTVRAATLPTLISMALVLVPTPVVPRKRASCAVTFTPWDPPSVSASVIAPPAFRLTTPATPVPALS